jgi:hypothetical protein
VDLIPNSLENVSNPLGWEQSCAAGQFDSYAQQLGTNLVAAGLENSVIRLGPEMNGPWEADFIGSTTVEQNMWATCFANEVTALRQATGEHFLIDWNPNACYENVPYANYYPGNAYVDIVGLDLYDGVCAAPSSSTTPITWTQLANEPGGLTSFEAFAKTHGKSMSFPEWGLLQNPNGDDPTYVNGIGSTFVAQDFAFETYFDAGDDSVLQVGPATPRSLVRFQKWFGHVSNYRLGNARSCRSHYVKRVIRTTEAERVKVVGKWEMKRKAVWHIECVYVAPITITTESPTTTTTESPTTTTTESPTTTTTEPFIYDQATTIKYDSFLSYTEEIGGLYYATEDADLTITGYSLSPAAGTVDFYDANGDLICSGVVPNSFLGTVVSCGSVGLAAATPTPISAVYSGTQFGYDDGYGTSYAGSST